MMKGIAIICVALFLAAFKQNNLPQISEPTFFKASKDTRPSLQLLHTTRPHLLQ